MEIFLEVVGVVLLAIAYFLLQTYTGKKTRIPSKLNNPELIPIIENQTNNEVDRVSFEDLVDEMTTDESETEHDDFDNQSDEQSQEHFTPSNTSNNEDYSKLEKEVIRLSKIVEDLDKKVHGGKYKKSFPPKNIFQDTNSLKNAFIVSEVLKPKFKSEH